MGKATVSVGQAIQALSVLGNNIDWDQIDPELLQKKVINNPVGIGKQFTAFLKAGGLVYLTENLKLACDAFNPAQFISEGWGIWRGPLNGNGREGAEDQDDRALAMTEVDFSQIRFETSLKKGETLITGEEKLKRLKASGDIRFGGSQFLALWGDYQDRGEGSVLEWLRKTQGVTYFDFFGTILRNPRGDRYVLCLSWRGGRWRWDYHWLDRGWDASFFAVVGSANDFLA